jgi:hypothetical protein
MKSLAIAALLLCLAASAGARATEPAARPTQSSFQDHGALVAIDLFADFISIAAEAALLDQVVSSSAPPEEGADARQLDDSRAQVSSRPRDARDSYDDPPPYGYAPRRARHRDARQGFLFSFGLGGSGLHVSPQAGTGAFDFDLRMGYGFSDRFQFFGDLTVDSGQYNDGSSISSWTLTARGQTVLIGDRDGNGLNINAGLGFGGISRSVCGGSCYDYGYGYDQSQSSPIGLAAGAGLSYDARLGRSFRLSPEFFFNWHQVPNDAGRAADIATAVGFRLNLLWYVQ